MRRQLVAYAEDCIVRGEVDLPEGRLSDVVNASDTLRFERATLEALDDGRVVDAPELEVDRHDLHLVEAAGATGDPARRTRTATDRVTLQVGPFVVTGDLHRTPWAEPLASLTRWTKFVPVTDAEVALVSGGGARRSEVVLVNRERIGNAALVGWMDGDALIPEDATRTRRGVTEG